MLPDIQAMSQDDNIEKEPPVSVHPRMCGERPLNFLSSCRVLLPFLKSVVMVKM